MSYLRAESNLYKFSIKLFAIFLSNVGAPAALERWYSPKLVQEGETIFINSCASCHGQKAQGIHSDWREPLADGNYPAPPLNGSAHAWHHPISVLAQYVYNGGKKYGGVMPAFKGQLSQQEIVSTIAYFQSYWNDELYQKWLDNDGLDVKLNFNQPKDGETQQ